ncbi:hypothetical protein M7I_4274 [Glarea lozoyensis 74030]|uniref:Uncharacterized protein n=1 Tax=Glarea lozoyensis (strain ATCC 74030 / MF5533) TaxID=1104152 RepID=H0ENR1_GLAL7|nr:hypothetical protein M7I_4274 [Glarea lozoyensis 74030]
MCHHHPKAFPTNPEITRSFHMLASTDSRRLCKTILVVFAAVMKVCVDAVGCGKDRPRDIEGLSKEWSNQTQNILAKMRESVLQLCVIVLVERKCECGYAEKVAKSLQRSS